MTLATRWTLTLFRFAAAVLLAGFAVVSARNGEWFTFGLTAVLSALSVVGGVAAWRGEKV